jgi:thiamine pyrophosphate-dependent acetolactate synthase large subunit-like protein
MKTDSPVTFKPETAADAWVGLLAARGVDYLFANGGTDFAPVVEAYAKGEKLGWRLPEVVIVPHENMGIAMAHGYAMVSGRPQAMMVHVGVGTANTLNGLINASRQNVPLLLTAGRTPITESGALPAARNNYIHWAQEHFDQGAMLREFVKWDYELRHPEQVETVLDRALAIAKSEPQGPVYVTLPREILAQPFTLRFSQAPTIVPASPPAADPDTVERAARLLGAAKNPLLITANGGRTAEAARAIAELAEIFALPVVHYRPRYLALSTEHPCSAAGTRMRSSRKPTSSWWSIAMCPGFRRKAGRSPRRRSSISVPIPFSRVIRCAAFALTSRLLAPSQAPCRRFAAARRSTPSPRGSSRSAAQRCRKNQTGFARKAAPASSARRPASARNGSPRA